MFTSKNNTIHRTNKPNTNNKINYSKIAIKILKNVEADRPSSSLNRRAHGCAGYAMATPARCK